MTLAQLEVWLLDRAAELTVVGDGRTFTATIKCPVVPNDRKAVGNLEDAICAAMASMDRAIAIEADKRKGRPLS